MAYERQWQAVAPKNFLADGTVNGYITLADTKGFKLRQTVRVTSATQESVDLIIKKVDIDKLLLSETESSGGPVNLSKFLLVDGATVEGLEQAKKDIPFEQAESNTYEPEPVNAKRRILVDPFTGDKYDKNNPLPVDAVVNIDNINFPVSKIPDIFNVSAPAADTAYNFVLPINTKGYRIKVRDNSSKFKTFWAASEINSKYLSHTRGTVYVKENMDLTAPLIVFFSVAKGPQTIEVEYWT